MFYTLRRLYKAGRLTEANLTVAVSLNWINEIQKEQIMAS
jgi:hypothetical protein